MINTPTILLTTLNAKYIHASLGLRYLLANMGDLKPQTALREFTIARPPEDVVKEIILALEGPRLDSASPGPQIVGFGIYIWNVVQSTEVIRRLKAARPQIKVVLGGPEVSHETGQQEITRLADHVITDWGDLTFASLCRAILAGTQTLPQVMAGEQPPLDQLQLPYAEYTDADLAHRLLYVEASRGCPFKCEFCLSALDKTAWAFDLERFLASMAELYRRGARNFKFVDRTFNLKIEFSIRILQFFLDRLKEQDSAQTGKDLLVHFELVPDNLPVQLQAMIAQFPPGVLQFEIGIQSFNVDVQQHISRRQDNEKSVANLRWLTEHSQAHLHTDLLFGLPGETLESFGAGFDRLFALHPHEIQLGILKRLRGAPIIRHSIEYKMVYDTHPPYAVQETGAVDAATVQRFGRFARYWDLLANSGRFKRSLALLLNQPLPAEGRATEKAPHSPFAAFMKFTDWLWLRTTKTHGFTPEHLIDALDDYLRHLGEWPAPIVKQALLADYLASGARGSPQALRGLLPKRAPPRPAVRHLAHRQAQHIGGPERILLPPAIDE